MAIPFLGKKDKGGTNAPPSKSRAIPAVGLLSQVRRVHEQALEDYSGSRFAVWRVQGCDSSKAQVINGWSLALNSIEYPVQILIRQHAPDLSDVRRKYLDAQPEHMREGRINNVGNSLLDYLKSMEDGGGVVARSWYAVVGESHVVEFSSVMTQSGFNAVRLDDGELSLLLQACVSGMGYGHTQDFYQVQEQSRFLELNYRYMSVYEVEKWPRRISLLFLEQMLRNGDEMDISIWLWPATQRESHTRLQMQRSRFEGSRIVSMQKGKLVPPEVDLAISDVIRISDSVERGTSKLFRRSMNVAVYGRSRDELRDAGERLTGHFRSNLAKISQLRLRQGKGFAAMMPVLRPGSGPVDLTDTDTMLRMFPFGPQDMNHREGPMLRVDLRSRTPVIQNPFSSAAMNGHLVAVHGPLRGGQVLLHQAPAGAGGHAGRPHLPDRSRGGVRGDHPGPGRQGVRSRLSGPRPEPLRHRLHRRRGGLHEADFQPLLPHRRDAGGPGGHPPEGDHRPLPHRVLREGDPGVGGEPSGAGAGRHPVPARVPRIG